MGVVIHPRRMPPAAFITRNRWKINQTLDSGYRTVMGARKRIRNFLHP